MRHADLPSEGYLLIAKKYQKTRLIFNPRLAMGEFSSYFKEASKITSNISLQDPASWVGLSISPPSGIPGSNQGSFTPRATIPKTARLCGTKEG
jgi:hypothetical protein